MSTPQQAVIQFLTRKPKTEAERPATIIASIECLCEHVEALRESVHGLTDATQALVESEELLRDRYDRIDGRLDAAEAAIFAIRHNDPDAWMRVFEKLTQHWPGARSPRAPMGG